MAIILPPFFTASDYKRQNPNTQSDMAFEWILARHKGTIIRSGEDVLRDHKEWEKKLRARRAQYAVVPAREQGVTLRPNRDSGLVDFGHPFNRNPNAAPVRKADQTPVRETVSGEYIPPNEGQEAAAADTTGQTHDYGPWASNSQARARTPKQQVKKRHPLWGFAEKALGGGPSGSRLNSPGGRVGTVFIMLLILFVLVVLLVPVSINGVRRTRWQLTGDVITGKAAIPGGV